MVVSVEEQSYIMGADTSFNDLLKPVYHGKYLTDSISTAEVCKHPLMSLAHNLSNPT